MCNQYGVGLYYFTGANDLYEVNPGRIITRIKGNDGATAASH